MDKVQKHAAELMPNSKEAQRILELRAKQLAQQESGVNENNGIPYVRFRLGQNECYGISYQFVHEVLHQATLAKPPCTPHFVAGVINWRGSLITVVDLLKFFHPHHPEHECGFIIVINANDMVLGILVDRVDGSESYQPNQLSMPLSSVEVANPEYILGLHHSVIAILNTEVFVSGLSQEIKKEISRIGDVYGNCH